MSKKILIVDDERNVRMTYRVALETEGFQVFEASDGPEALETLKTTAFDLAILDLRMPEMDGMRLLKEMRALDVAIPVIIITAFGDVPQAVDAMKHGAIDFLQKPVRPGDLRGVVNDIIRRHHPAFQQPPRNEFEAQMITTKRSLNRRDFAGAKEHLLKALEINDQSADAFNLAGVFFEMQEDYTRAERYYKRALKLNRKHEGAQANMRRIFELFHFGSSKEPFNLGNG